MEVANTVAYYDTQQYGLIFHSNDPWLRIHNTSFSLKPTDGPNQLEQSNMSDQARIEANASLFYCFFMFLPCWGANQVPYSQHSIFLVTYEMAQ